MHVEQNWASVKRHYQRLNTEDLYGIAVVLFSNEEAWIEDRLTRREDEALAMEILGFLGHHGSQAAVKVLLKYLTAHEEIYQLAASEALKQCKLNFMVDPLIEIMQKQGQNAIKAGEVLLSFGGEGIDILWRLWFMPESPTSLKVQILHLITEAADKRAERIAFLALVSGEEELVQAAVRSAEKLKLTSLWGSMISYITDSSWKLRGSVIRLLGQWEAVEALPFLLVIENEADPWVEEERRKAIARLIEIKQDANREIDRKN